eukprot:scaffold14616_cov36-Cyclotella_meneghiniana.AAC.1
MASTVSLATSQPLSVLSVACCMPRATEDEWNTADDEATEWGQTSSSSTTTTTTTWRLSTISMRPFLWAFPGSLPFASRTIECASEQWRGYTVT